MIHSRKRWALPIAIGLCGAALFAQQPLILPPPPQVDPPSESFRGKAKELTGHPFLVSGLKLTILDFVPDTSPAGYLPLVGWAFRREGVRVRVENLSSAFQPYAPTDLVFASSDGQQVVVTKERIEGHWRAPMGTAMAPGTHFESTLMLSESIKLPARIYYQNHLLAVVTE